MIFGIFESAGDLEAGKIETRSWTSGRRCCAAWETIASYRNLGPTRYTLNTELLPHDRNASKQILALQSLPNKQSSYMTMPTLRNTVDRLDRPSAYFLGKVSLLPSTKETFQRLIHCAHRTRSGSLASEINQLMGKRIVRGVLRNQRIR